MFSQMRSHSPEVFDNSEMGKRIVSEDLPQAMGKNHTTGSTRKFSDASSAASCSNQYDYFTPQKPSNS